jgi:hypothetical protein
VKEFESQCAKLTAIIYPYEETVIVSQKEHLLDKEKSNAELNNFNIESYFQKDFRLKAMN